MRIVFAGTPEFSLPCLQALIDSKHEVCAVYTQPDRPAGRGRKLTPTPVKALAMAHDIAVFQPQSVRSQQQVELLAELNPDVMVVIAYGLLLPKAILQTPKYGCINVHASLLPQWRGASPIQQAILAGDVTTGVTIMQMDEGMDTGDMLNIVECAIEENETSQQLHDKLSKLGVTPLLQTLDAMQQGKLQPVKQDDAKASYAGKINKQAGEIIWRDSARNVHNKIRAYNPWPVAYTHLNSQVLRIHQSLIHSSDESAQAGEILGATKEGILVACGEGALLLTQLQLPGGKALTAQQILNSKRDLFSPGVVLGQ